LTIRFSYVRSIVEFSYNKMQSIIDFKRLAAVLT
jgi:hypothetical protein